MSIRTATSDDLPSILSIYNQAIQSTTATYDYEPEKLARRQTWFAWQQEHEFPVLVATGESGTVVGWGCLSQFNPKEGYRYTAQNTLYVDAPCRGQGIGKQLLSALMKVARDGEWHSVVALIDADNHVSLGLHARFGFTEVARLKEVGFKFNRWLDVVYMQSLLPAKT